LNSAFLNISQHFTSHLFRPWISNSAGGIDGGPGERGAWSEMAADRDLIRESFEKQPVRTVAEACERTLSTNAVAQELATQSGITLLYLPSYSPNLILSQPASSSRACQRA
jgi:hypothetical protein